MFGLVLALVTLAAAAIGGSGRIAARASRRFTAAGLSAVTAIYSVFADVCIGLLPQQTHAYRRTALAWAPAVVNSTGARRRGSGPGVVEIDCRARSYDDQGWPHTLA